MKIQPEIARDEADVQSLLSTLEGWVNPFQSQGQDLICLPTRKVATEDVARDLQAKDLGKRVYRKFSEERLEVNPPKVRFRDKMSKAKLKTFSHINKSGAPKRNRQRDCTQGRPCTVCTNDCY